MVETSSRKNYFLLALTIVYCFIGILQLFADAILPAQLYLSIAFVSVIVAALEWLKGWTKWIYVRRKKYTYKDAIAHEKKHIEILGQYPILSDFTQVHQTVYEQMLDFEKNIEQSKTMKHLDRLLSFIDGFIPFTEALGVVFAILIIPLLKIPNDLRTAKIINILSIFSVAFAFLSMYMSDAYSKKLEQQDKSFTMRFMVSDYYLNIIKLISSTQADTTSEKGAEQNNS